MSEETFVPPTGGLRPRLLDPTNDLVFKLLLTGPDSHEVLRYVLEAVLRPAVPIADFVVADPNLRPTALDEKEIVFDVRVILVDGTEIDVEMQSRPMRRLRDRLVYYGARGLAGQLEPGDSYDELRPSIVIAFLGYREFDDARFHRRLQLADDTSQEVFSSILQVHTVELPKLGPLDDDEATRHDPLVVFARFLTAETDDELRAIAEESPAMKRAVDLLTQLSSDETVRRRAADRAVRLRLDAADKAAEIREARQEGHAEGLAEGVELGRAEGVALGLDQGIATGREHALREIAIRLREQGTPDERIAALIGVDVATAAALAAGPDAPAR